MSKFFVMIDNKEFKDWGRIGQAIEMLHMGSSMGIETTGGGVFLSEAFERLLGHKNLAAGLHKLIMQYRHGLLPMEKMELSLRNIVGEVGFPNILEKSFMDVYGKFKKIYKCETYRAQLVISNVNNGKNFIRNCWPITGESALAWGVRELWIQGLMFWISHNYVDKGTVKFPDLVVYTFPLIRVKASGTIEPHPTKGKPWLLMRTYAGLYDQSLEEKVTPDELVINKHTDEIILAKDGKLPFEVVWNDNEIKLKERKANDKGSLISDEQCMDIVKVLRNFESKTLFPLNLSWQLVDKKVILSAINRHELDDGNSYLQTGLNVLSHGQGVVRGLISGELVNVDLEKSVIKRGDIWYISKWKDSYGSQIAYAGGAIIGNLARNEMLELQSILHEYGIVSVIASLDHLDNLPQTVTIDGIRGIVYTGNLTHRLSGSHKQIKRNIIDEIKTIDKKVTATKQYLQLSNLKCALPDLDNISGLVISADSIWNEVDTHPEYLTENKKLHLIQGPLSDQLTELCLANGDKNILFEFSRLTGADWKAMKFGRAYENKLASYGAVNYLEHNEQFECELEVIKQVRHKTRITNLWIQIPGVRDIGQIMEIKKQLAAKGLVRTSSLQLWVSLETIQMIEYIGELKQLGVDGITIDSDKLLQYYTGRSDWSIDNTVLSLLAKTLLQLKKYHLPHRLKIDSKFNDKLLYELMKNGLNSVEVDMDTQSTIYEELKQAELRLVKK